MGSLAIYHVIAGPESLVSNEMFCAVGLEPFYCVVHIVWASKVRNSSCQFGDVEVDVGAGLQILGWIADETANDILCIQSGLESLRFCMSTLYTYKVPVLLSRLLICEDHPLITFDVRRHGFSGGVVGREARSDSLAFKLDKYIELSHLG